MTSRFGGSTAVELQDSEIRPLYGPKLPASPFEALVLSEEAICRNQASLVTRFYSQEK